MTTALHTQSHVALRSPHRPVCHPVPAPRALVVAKEARFRRWARGQLRASGFEILVTEDGYDAALAVACDPPDVIVVDHGAPWFGVICLLNRLCCDPALRTIPVLLVAPRASGTFVEACRALGVAVLVRPPGDPQAVLHMPQPQPAQRGNAEVGDPAEKRNP